MNAALEIVGLSRRFGGLVATNDVSLRLERGARHALIGPNGAGKTTLINLLSGVLAPSAGRILLDGTDITALRPDARVHRGLVRTFQINQLFADLTPLTTVGLAVSRRLGLDRQFWRRLGSKGEIVDECVAILERFDLLGVMNERVGALPYGRQRLLEIALAIACGPRVLLLDEPAAGVPEGEREGILAGVAALPVEVSVLLIEHDMDLVFRFAQRISVLVNGSVLMQGSPAEVAADARVREVYLGEEVHG
ncbi:MAG: ABC transporter ATP-binding protein [Rhodospirillales bacterium]|nr:ABC transporter ATP-binding protein [Rhodospirillales bacterium]MDE2198328.1 ABC transporter ATP-binding protein [Rhodospirillales bacterium]MDE2575509.1 ABC transporter ATP-binding protein [Rhodospirillales bacterium]